MFKLKIVHLSFGFNISMKLQFFKNTFLVSKILFNSLLVRRLLYILIPLFFLINCKQNTAYAETAGNFDSIYYNIATEVSGKDLDLAIYLSDSLVKTAPDSLSKMRSLMLSATLKERKGEVVDAINKSKAAELIAKKLNNTEWQMRILGFLYSTYENIGIMEKAAIILEELERINKKEKTPLIQLYIYQSKANANIYKKKFENALINLEQSDSILEGMNIKQKVNLHWGTTAQLKGIVYYHLDLLDSSKYYLFQALDALPEVSYVLVGYVNAYLAKCYLKEENWNEFFKYLAITKEFIEGSNDFKLQILYHEIEEAYAKSINDKNLENEHKMILYELKVERAAYINTLSNEIIKDLNLDSERKKKLNYIFITLLVLGLFFTLMLYYFINRSQKRKFQKIVQEIQEELREKENKIRKQQERISEKGAKDNDEELIKLNKVNEKDNSNDNTINIPEETISKILKRLKNFESGKKFLQKDISLAKLAILIKTNTKYLSYTLNLYKKQDFNNYINELRIKYILHKLIEDESYLQYKIAYLADEAGFSSHSKFTAVFRQYTGITPSKFITNRKKELQNL